MSKVKTNTEYLARLVEISQLINPQHGNHEAKAFKNTTAKKGRLSQLDDAAGLNIETIRQKLLKAKPVSQTELNLIRNAVETWYQSRNANNSVARVAFHAIAAVFTVGLFHLGYLVARLINKNLPLDSSKEVFSVFRSYKAMKKVERFLSDTKDFMPNQSYSTVNEALDKGKKGGFEDFTINTAELDAIDLSASGEEEDTVEENAEGQKKTFERDYDASDDESQSFGFNTYL